MKFSARILGFLFAFFLIFLFSKYSYAQNTTQTTPPNQYLAPNTNSDVPNNLHTWTQNVMIEVISALSCQVTGIDPTTSNQKCLGTNSKTGKIGYIEKGSGGILGFATNSIVTLYTPPLHSGDYLRYLAGSFGITKPALAQSTPGFEGFGVSRLSPLTKLWVVFRNFVYLMYVLVFIVIGLAIMFRVKIDPRTVMSIQNQIPKIIVSLILVTFSFAIAGFLIDLMYAVSYLLISIVFKADSSLTNSAIAYNLMGATNPIDAINTVTNRGTDFAGLANISWGSAGAIGGHLGVLFDNPPGKIITGTIISIFSLMLGATVGQSIPFVGSLIGSVVAGAIGGIFFAKDIAGGVLTAIVFLIVTVAIIAALFRLWFQLLIAYVSILIDIIFAPVWIIAGLVPGSKISFGSWLRDLLANLSAFPVVLVMFALARIFMDAFTDSSGKGLENTFVPPLIGNPAEPTQLGALIALGIILTTPSVVKLMKSVFKTPGVSFSPVMEGLTSGTGIIVSPVRKIGGALFGETRSGDQKILSGYFKRKGGDIKYNTRVLRNRILRRPPPPRPTTGGGAATGGAAAGGTGTASGAAGAGVAGTTPTAGGAATPPPTPPPGHTVTPTGIIIPPARRRRGP